MVVTLLKVRMKRLIVDMDDVLADATGQFINYYEKEFGVRVERSVLNNKNEGEGFPDNHSVLRQFPYRVNFFRDMESGSDGEAKPEIRGLYCQCSHGVSPVAA